MWSPSLDSMFPSLVHLYTNLVNKKKTTNKAKYNNKNNKKETKQ